MENFNIRTGSMVLQTRIDKLLKEADRLQKAKDYIDDLHETMFCFHYECNDRTADLVKKELYRFAKTI